MGMEFVEHIEASWVEHKPAVSAVPALGSGCYSGHSYPVNESRAGCAHTGLPSASIQEEWGSTSTCSQPPAMSSFRTPAQEEDDLQKRAALPYDISTTSYAETD